MAPHDSQPWNPDRAWADPFIALLLVVVLALGNGVLRGSQARAQAPDVQATLQGRLQDAVLGGSKALEASNPLPGLRLPLPSGAGLAEGARSFIGKKQLVVRGRRFTMDCTGLVLAKLDGTAKGGIVIAIHEELGIPIKLIGVGEQLDDLRPFDPDEFARALFGEGTAG